MFERIINKFWRTVFLPKARIRLNKSAYKVPRLHVNSFYKATYDSEPWLLVLLEKIHKAKNLNSIIDVGINIGQTLLKIKSINPDIKYVGFEPNPFCFSFVQQLIKTNDLSNCEIIPCGLSDKSQLLKLSLDTDLFDSSATLIEGFREPKSQKFQFVSVLTFDSIVNGLQLDKIDIIKIDIEGAELEAVIGLIKTLKKHKPIIIMEVLPSYSIENKFRINRQNKLSKILLAEAYKIFKIGNNRKKILLNEVLDFPIHKNFNDSDYLLIPDTIKVEELNLEN